MTSSSFSGMSTTVSSGLDFLLLVIPAPAFHSVLCRRRSFLTRALKGVIVAFPRLKTEMTRRYFVRSGFRHGAKGASEVTGGIRGREREREKKKRRQTGSRKRGREREEKKQSSGGGNACAGAARDPMPKRNDNWAPVRASGGCGCRCCRKKNSAEHEIGPASRLTDRTLPFRALALSVRLWHTVRASVPSETAGGEVRERL